MKEHINKDLFCDICSIQFDKKFVYDMHLSLVHLKKTEIKFEPENYEDFLVVKDEKEINIKTENPTDNVENNYNKEIFDFAHSVHEEINIKTEYLFFPEKNDN